MKILAIDPGNIETGFCVWNSKTEKMVTKDYINNKLFLQNLDNKITTDWGVEDVIIEMFSSYGGSFGQTSIDSCVFIGMLKEKLEWDHKVVLVFRQTIKMHHCKTLRGVNDGAVNCILREKYGEDNTKKKPNEVYWNKEVEKFGGRKWMNGDIWSSMAIATWYCEPKDNPLANPKDREDFKLSPFLKT